jgi:hypothetical protein
MILLVDGITSRLGILNGSLVAHIDGQLRSARFPTFVCLYAPPVA